MPNITALSNISFATILTNIFAKQKFFLFSYFVNLDKKKKKKYTHKKKESFRMILQKEKIYRDKNYQSYE